MEEDENRTGRAKKRDKTVVTDREKERKRGRSKKEDRRKVREKNKTGRELLV